MNKRIIYGAILCLIAGISWGAMFPVAHHSFRYIDPFYFTIFRYIPVAVILAGLLWMMEGKRAFKTEGKGLSLWFFGTMAFTVYNLFIFWGQDALGESGVLLASVMEALMPMLAVLIIWLFKGKRPNAYTLSCVVVALIGVMFIITKGDVTTLLVKNGQLVPVFALLLAVIGWVVYTMGGGQFSNWSVLRYSALSCLYGVVTATVIVLGATMLGWAEAPTLAAVNAVKWDLTFMVIFPGVIALLGWNVGVSILKPVNGLLFINFVPITTVAIAYFQGYSLTIFDWVGVLLVIAALTLNAVLSRWQVKVRISFESRSRSSRIREGTV